MILSALPSHEQAAIADYLAGATYRDVRDSHRVHSHRLSQLLGDLRLPRRRCGGNRHRRCLTIDRMSTSQRETYDAICDDLARAMVRHHGGLPERDLLTKVTP